MLIRVNGGAGGIKDYLENGQKKGREFSRDELDERVILAGDLAATDEIIQTMQADGEKYLHITLAFKEEELDRDTLNKIVDDFREFAFSAFKDDEYDFYAEAHLPKIKSYVHHGTGQFVERKPHIHIVIPKSNLMTDEHVHLNPFGMVDKNERFIDAFQEHVNNKYGLASPKENRRFEFTGESEMISRYKGDIFVRQRADLRKEFLSELLSKKIESWDGFKQMLDERGRSREVDGKYATYMHFETEKGKGVNLKDKVFSREFIELPTEQKIRRLAPEIERSFVAQQAARLDPEYITETLKQWHQVGARETKYLNSGNSRLTAEYKAADSDERRAILSQREARFYAKHSKETTHEQAQGKRGQRFAGAAGHEREYGFKRAAGQSRADGSATRDRQRYAEPGGKKSPPQSLNSVRSLSSVGVVRFTERSEVLLPDHARHQLEHGRAERVDGVRRTADRERDGKLGATGRHADNVVGQLARDVRENKQARSAERKGDMQEIKQQLDARRLLADLSRSHGVIPEKYEVTKGKDGGDRIKCGTRNLNVSDFLTKHLNMPWKEADKTLRDSYSRQTGRELHATPRQQARRQLWAEFQAERGERQQQRTQKWEAQRRSESSRLQGIKQEYQAKKSRVYDGRGMTPAARRAAASVARMERVTKESALREQIQRERELLKAEQRRPATEQYREFLAGKAQAGDEYALSELRRMRPEPAERERAAGDVMKPAERQADHEREPIHRAPTITHKVHHNGEVTYKRDGREMLRDSSEAIHMLQTDDRAIETGLRLAQQKFGGTLSLAGSKEFQERTACAAAEAGMKVAFTDQRLNEIMLDRRAEIAAHKAHEAEARRLARDFAKMRGTGEAKAAAQEVRASDARRGSAAAAPSDSKAPHADGRYTGEVVAVDKNYVYQRHGRDTIRHDRNQFNEAPKLGDTVQVQYRDGRATVKNVGQQRELDQDQDQSRGL
jgi:hypothetical protein